MSFDQYTFVGWIRISTLSRSSTINWRLPICRLDNLAKGDAIDFQ
jgi:hypothetical protein